jgi:hypothetical protein
MLGCHISPGISAFKTFAF